MKQLLSFRETKAFTRDVSSLLSEESYFAFQNYLQDHFDLGDLIPGGGGLQKIRWQIAGKGKAAVFGSYIIVPRTKVTSICWLSMAKIRKPIWKKTN